MKDQNIENEELKNEGVNAEQNESVEQPTAEAIEETQHPDDAQTETESKAEEAPAVDSWEAKYKEVNDKYLRLYSEFENFRRRTAKEKLALMQTAGEDVIKDLLPVLDDLERARKSNETAEDIDAVKEGFHLVYNKFHKTLESKGVKEMKAQEEPFDVELHEALTKIPAPTEDLKGKVVDVIEKGYLLNEKVIRYAKVVVGE